MNAILLRIAMMSSRNLLIGCLAVGGAYYYLIYNDGSAEKAQIAAATAEIQKEEAKAKDAENALKEVEKIRAAVATLSDQFVIVSKQLPAQYNMPELIRSIDAIARASGVSIKLKEPKTPKAEKDAIVETMPVKVVLEGQFSEIAMFFYYIASLERITRVKNFSMNMPVNGDIRRTRLYVDAEVLSYRFVGAPIATTNVKGKSP